MTDCKKVRSQIPLWLDGLLSAGEVTQVEQHLSVCSECRQDRARLVQVIEAVRSVDRVTASAGFTEAVLEALEPETTSVRPWPVWRWAGGVVGLAAAAGLALILWAEGPGEPQESAGPEVAQPAMGVPAEYVLAEVPIFSAPLGIVEVEEARPEELARALATLERLVGGESGMRIPYVLVNY